MIYQRSSDHNLYPTNPFTILKPRDQEIGEFLVVQERRPTDFKAQNYKRVRRVVGWPGLPCSFCCVFCAPVACATSSG